MTIPSRGAILIAALSLVACSGASEMEQAAVDTYMEKVNSVLQQGVYMDSGRIVEAEELEGGVLITCFDTSFKRSAFEDWTTGDAMFWVEGDTLFAVNLLAQKVFLDAPVAPEGVKQAAERSAKMAKASPQEPSRWWE